MNKSKGGIDPRTLPAIKYCKLHALYVNLLPTISSHYNGESFVYRVVCEDCGTYGEWKGTPRKAIESWNEKNGVSA